MRGELGKSVFMKEQQRRGTGGNFRSIAPLKPPGFATVPTKTPAKCLSSSAAVLVKFTNKEALSSCRGVYFCNAPPCERAEGNSFFY
jgi:hypothetical protein